MNATPPELRICRHLIPQTHRHVDAIVSHQRSRRRVGHALERLELERSAPRGPAGFVADNIGDDEVAQVGHAQELVQSGEHEVGAEHDVAGVGTEQAVRSHGFAEVDQAYEVEFGGRVIFGHDFGVDLFAHEEERPYVGFDEEAGAADVDFDPVSLV